MKRGAAKQFVIVDAGMNDLLRPTLYEAYQHIRPVRQNPAARTIVVTGYRSEMDELVRQVLQEGADDVCYKPFDVPRLLESLDKMTGAPKRN